MLSNKDLTVPPQEWSKERPRAKGRNGGEGEDRRERKEEVTHSAAISSQLEPWIRTQ